MINAARSFAKVFVISAIRRPQRFLVSQNEAIGGSASDVSLERKFAPLSAATRRC
jgi:hypothetical protein